MTISSSSSLLYGSKELLRHQLEDLFLDGTPPNSHKQTKGDKFPKLKAGKTTQKMNRPVGLKRRIAKRPRLSQYRRSELLSMGTSFATTVTSQDSSHHLDPDEILFLRSLGAGEANISRNHILSGSFSVANSRKIANPCRACMERSFSYEEMHTLLNSDFS